MTIRLASMSFKAVSTLFSFFSSPSVASPLVIKRMCLVSTAMSPTVCDFRNSAATCRPSTTEKENSYIYRKTRGAQFCKGAPWPADALVLYWRRLRVRISAVVWFGRNHQALTKQKAKTLWTKNWPNRKGLQKRDQNSVKRCRFLNVTLPSFKNWPAWRWQKTSSNDPTLISLAQKTLSHFSKLWGPIPPHSLIFKKF